MTPGRSPAVGRPAAGPGAPGLDVMCLFDAKAAAQRGFWPEAVQGAPDLMCATGPEDSGSIPIEAMLGVMRANIQIADWARAR